MMTDVYTLRKRKGFSLRERNIIAGVWGNTCAYCRKAEGPFAIDHIIPHSEGGSCDYHNLCLSCVKCNAQKSDARLPTLHEGLLLGIAKRKSIRIKKRLSSTYSKPSQPKGVNHSGWLHEDKEHAIEVGKLLSSMLKLDYEETAVPRLDGFLPAREKLTFKIDKGLLVGLGSPVEEVTNVLRKTIIVHRNRCQSNLELSSSRDKQTGRGTFSIMVSKDRLKEFITLVQQV
jgi:hypothetical protein